MSKRANCGDDVGVFKPGQGCFTSAQACSRCSFISRSRAASSRAAARASTWTSHDAAIGVICSHLGPAAAAKFYECDFCDQWCTKWKTLQSYNGVCAHICKRCTSKWKHENPKTYTGSFWDEAGRQVVKDDIEITFGETICFEQGDACSGAPYMKKDDKEKKDDNGEKNDDQDKPLF